MPTQPLLWGMGLTFTSLVLDDCCIGWPSCFNVLGFRPQVLTEEVLSERARRQTGNFCAFGLPTFHLPAPLHAVPPGSLPPRSASYLPLREKACLPLGSPTLLPRPTLAGAGRIALMGLAAASNEGLPRALLLSSGVLGLVVNRSTLKKFKKNFFR